MGYLPLRSKIGFFGYFGLFFQYFRISQAIFLEANGDIKNRWPLGVFYSTWLFSKIFWYFLPFFWKIGNGVFALTVKNRLFWPFFQHFWTSKAIFGELQGDIKNRWTLRVLYSTWLFPKKFWYFLPFFCKIGNGVFALTVEKM